MPFKTLLKRLLDRSYHLAKIRWIRRLRRGTNDPVIVFTMGKTGSTAVVNAVAPTLPNRSVLHVHRLTNDGVRAAEHRWRSQSRGPRPTNVWEAEFTRRLMAGSARTWDLITLVRDPLSQAVSSFFETSVVFGHLHDDVAQMAETFLEVHDWRLPIEWFEREFEPVTGIDVYAHRFDPAAGCSVIGSESARVLILRKEDLSRIGEQALTRFLDPGADLVLRRENVSAQKPYAAQYERFRAAVPDVIPESVLDELYDSRYARHFYTDAEIRRFRSRWG